MIVKMTKRLPRYVCLREQCDLTVGQYRALQAGDEVDVSAETGDYMIANNWIEQIDSGGDMEGDNGERD